MKIKFLYIAFILLFSVKTNLGMEPENSIEKDLLHIYKYQQLAVITTLLKPIFPYIIFRLIQHKEASKKIPKMEDLD